MKGDDGEWLYDTDYWHEGTDFWDNYNEHEDPTFEWLDDSPEAIAEASQEERVKELEILLKREQIQCRIYRKTLEENGFVMLKEGTPGNGRFA